MKLANRIPRKAIPIGSREARWYLEQNGDITIYGFTYKGEAFSAQIKKRQLKAVRAIDTTGGAK